MHDLRALIPWGSFCIDAPIYLAGSLPGALLPISAFPWRFDVQIPTTSPSFALASQGIAWGPAGVSLSNVAVFVVE